MSELDDIHALELAVMDLRAKAVRQDEMIFDLTLRIEGLEGRPPRKKPAVTNLRWHLFWYSFKRFLVGLLAVAIGAGVFWLVMEGWR